MTDTSRGNNGHGHVKPWEGTRPVETHEKCDENGGLVQDALQEFGKMVREELREAYSREELEP